MTTQHRQSLSVAPVFNPARQPSVRYIDAAVFKLWRHWMVANHGFEVMEPESYIWVPSSEERRHDQLFSHCEQRLAVTRLSFESFNDRTHETEHRVRFVPEADAEQIEQTLTQHFGGKNVYVSIEADSGCAITTHSQNHPAYIASSCSIPRGFAPVRSAMRS